MTEIFLLQGARNWETAIYNQVAHDYSNWLEYEGWKQFVQSLDLAMNLILPLFGFSHLEVKTL